VPGDTAYCNSKIISDHVFYDSELRVKTIKIHARCTKNLKESPDFLILPAKLPVFISKPSP
jgi:hypothetical protein